MTKEKNQAIDFDALTAFFPPHLIQWRYQRRGQQQGTAYFVPFIDSRTIMGRLDRVCGPENWKVEYTQVDARGIEIPLPESIWKEEIAKERQENQNKNRRDKPILTTRGGFLCTLFIRHEGEWIGKTDGADTTDIEPFKGSLTQGIRRAAVMWGISRYVHAIQGQYLAFQYVNGKPTPTQTPVIPQWAIPPEPVKEEAEAAPTVEEEEENGAETAEKPQEEAPQNGQQQQEQAPQPAEAPPTEAPPTEAPPAEAPPPEAQADPPQNGQQQQQQQQQGKTQSDGTEAPSPERVTEFRNFLGTQLERLGGVCDEVDEILKKRGLDKDESTWQVKEMVFASKEIRAIPEVPAN